MTYHCYVSLHIHIAFTVVKLIDCFLWNSDDVAFTFLLVYCLEEYCLWYWQWCITMTCCHHNSCTFTLLTAIYACFCWSWTASISGFSYLCENNCSLEKFRNYEQRQKNSHTPLLPKSRVEVCATYCPLTADSSGNVCATVHVPAMWMSVYLQHINTIAITTQRQKNAKWVMWAVMHSKY